VKSGTVPPSSPSAEAFRPVQPGGLNDHQGRSPEEEFVPAPKDVLAAKLAEARAALQVNRR
ncbi:helix-turn-helix domain-containing protein, partial [Salmonella enterica]